MTDLHKNIAKTLEFLDNDLGAVGWDLPPRIYFLMDDAEDPTARLVGLLGGPPVESLQMAYDQGYRIPNTALGAVVTFEMWRHLNADELLATHPDMLQSIPDAMVRDYGITPEGVDVREAVTRYYQEKMLPNLPPAALMPPHMRMDVRTMVAVLRDGTHFTLTHSRDQDDLDIAIRGPVDTAQARIPGYLYMLLHGLRPDDVNVLEAVDNYHMLQEMYEASE